MKKYEQRDKEILDYIRSVITEKGYAPSIRDICNALNIKSTSTVYVALDRLERSGYIRKDSGKSRSLRMENTLPGEKNPNNVVRVPVIGRVTAGQPILAIENYDGYVDFPKTGRPMPAGELFGLKVRGTSMIEAGILDGDIVIVERTSSAENGDIVVALIDDEATVKTFYKEKGHFRLQPENREMFPIIVNSLVILGKVVASVRYY